ncbi:hypothetical protein QWZ08_14460 [Ferruginibacter paludis]|uniref:hypothetical protein n=1 Tax=Ferruginibacter paludis TaxID=1310417 RepID=UPI0025B4980A|nr:hypothetical protein [Ferruginibacter paludis]MDN3656846.1 hypothetical protein [Ferruginibacter paludis]
MNGKTNRRKFIQTAAVTGAGISLFHSLPAYAVQLASFGKQPFKNTGTAFIPNRSASWWCTLEDIQWPQKQVVDKIKRRAEGFAKAGIDTAINFGFHNRFDFANYFSQLHGYYANVCEELHKNGVRFMDHYSCNDITRPRNEADFRYVHKFERHAVLLFPDPVARQYAQYEGYFYNDLCEVDLRDGSRGYAKQYQFEAFCHNNPNFLDMHKKYLQRLMKEVPFDGVEVDDMCSYPGNTTCGCKYCRDRFKKEYGHDIPDFSDKNFFGDITKDMLEWGNYDNPAYRDWLRMKADAVYDHVKMIKGVLGDKPLMTCCSNTGPIVLNAVALDLEKMAPYLDLFMLENVGTNIKNADWIEMDAEALHQKDIAQKRNNAPAMALSYAIFEKGAYFGWALARFWGVGNWSSTLNSRLEEDPAHSLEAEEAISRSNNWEKKYSDLNYRDGKDLVEVRLVNNSYCRENGWRDEAGHEHWDRSKAWSAQLVKHNVGYRFLRTAELADATALSKENTPLVMDGVGCVSDKQFTAIQSYLSKGGIAWVALPFGTQNEKGFARATPLSAVLLKAKYKNLYIIDSAVASAPLQKLIEAGKFKPVIRQLKGDQRWAARIRFYNGNAAIHFMNGGLLPVPDEVKDLSDVPLIKDIDSLITDNELSYEIDSSIRLSQLSLMSPELGESNRVADIRRAGKEHTVVNLNLEGIKIYAVAQ